MIIHHCNCKWMIYFIGTQTDSLFLRFVLMLTFSAPPRQLFALSGISGSGGVCFWFVVFVGFVICLFTCFSLQSNPQSSLCIVCCLAFSLLFIAASHCSVASQLVVAGVYFSLCIPVKRTFVLPTFAKYFTTWDDMILEVIALILQGLHYKDYHESLVVNCCFCLYAVQSEPTANVGSGFGAVHMLTELNYYKRSSVFPHPHVLLKSRGRLTLFYFTYIFM